MIVIRSSDVLYFDVDDTLVIWDKKIREERADEAVEFHDPHIKGLSNWLIPHTTHINILKRNFDQGRAIIVWSGAGPIWAESVIKTLKLEKYVTVVLNKPSVVVDDLPFHTWTVTTLYKPDFEA